MVESYYCMDVPCKLALITDSHDQPVLYLKESLEKNRPDVICIAGDFVYGHPPKNGLKMEESTNAMQLIRECVSVAWTCVSFGNHEWLLNDKDIEVIRSAGAVVLDNNWVEKDGVVFGGLTSGGMMNYRKYIKDHKIEDLYIGEFPTPRSFTPIPDIAWLDDYEKQEGYKVLLCHQPEYYKKYLQGKEIDLILSGHAHGGQIRFGKRGLYAPDQGLFPELTSGVIDNCLVISRGIAKVSRIPRINNPTEIIYILPKSGR